jgi:asparagine synthase (glutamine-hydrolysing)
MVAPRRIPWSIQSARRGLTEYLEHDLRTQFVAEYLTKVDGGTMHYALEARSPFFDQELWEYASALPYHVRLHQGRLKAVLRALAARRISPRVAEGRKRGFEIPVGMWITSTWRRTVEEAFSDSILGREGWIEPRAVLAQLRSIPSGTPAPVQLWYLYVLETWRRAEIERRDSSALAA